MEQVRGKEMDPPGSLKPSRKLGYYLKAVRARDELQTGSGGVGDMVEEVSPGKVGTSKSEMTGVYSKQQPKAGWGRLSVRK
jgi:hypothetical protein